jgi:hypothetical protein
MAKVKSPAWLAATLVGLAGLRVLWYFLENKADPDRGIDFWFQLGQGSGWHGLDLIRITADGRVSYEYRTSEGWTRKRFTINQKMVQSLKEKINALGIRNLKRAYHRPIADGTQWCLLIKEDDPPKSIYCDNQFPKPVVDLAEFVHENIVEPNSNMLKGVIVGERDHEMHEKELWNSIKNR